MLGFGVLVALVFLAFGAVKVTLKINLTSDAISFLVIELNLACYPFSYIHPQFT